MSKTAATWTISGFRGYADDAVEGSATPKADIDADWQQSPDQNFRVRLEITETAGGTSGNSDFQFQYNKNGTGWNDITTTSSNVKAVASPYFADGDDTTQQLGGGGTYVSENNAFSEDGTSGGTADFDANSLCEAEICLQIVGADTTNGDTIDIRCVVDATALTGVPVLPTITRQTIVTATADQSTTGGNWTQVASGNVLITVTGTAAQTFAGEVARDETVDSGVYYDGTVVDVNSQWTDDANAADGSTSTYAEATGARSGINGLTIQTNSASNLNNAHIKQVRMRVYAYTNNSTTDPILTCKALGASNWIYGTATKEGAAGWSSYVTLVEPVGGWNWTNLAAMGVRIECDEGVGLAAIIRIYKVELEVTFDSSTRYEYLTITCADSGPTDPDASWNNDANGFDDSLVTAATDTTTGTNVDNELYGVGTPAPSERPIIRGTGAVRVRLIAKAALTGSINGYFTVGDGSDTHTITIDTTVSDPLLPDFQTLTIFGDEPNWDQIEAARVAVYTETASGGSFYLAEVRVEVDNLDNSQQNTDEFWFDGNRFTPGQSEGWSVPSQAFDGATGTSSTYSGIGGGQLYGGGLWRLEEVDAIKEVSQVEVAWYGQTNLADGISAQLQDDAGTPNTYESWQETGKTVTGWTAWQVVNDAPPSEWTLAIMKVMRMRFTANLEVG